jgi:hypothetical protein
VELGGGVDCDMTDSRYSVSIYLRTDRQNATQMFTSTHVILAILMRQECKAASSVRHPKRKSKYTSQLDYEP